MRLQFDKGFQSFLSREHSGPDRFLIAVRFLSSLSCAGFAKLNLLGLVLLCASISVVGATMFPPAEASKLLPAVAGDFKATSPGSALDQISEEKIRDFNVVSAALRGYRSKQGDILSVSLVLTRSDSSAYSLLTSSGCPDGVGAANSTVPGLETKSCAFPTTVYFAKGPVYVHVMISKEDSVPLDTLKNLAQQIAATLDKGEGDMPALLKHLPGWESGNLVSQYAVSLPVLKNIVPNQSVFDSISFDGGVEAASAHYGASQLVIVEFNTPQLATDNNQRIVTRIQELRSQGQPAPSGYRRVGNYAVFVFGAPDEQAANQLIDQVKYQQVVQWLGHNPFSYEEATREFTETTLGVFVSVVKTSGLALLACLAVGGFFGALLFRFRRAQQRGRDEFADSEAMLRLNLDNLTPENDPQRLLGRGN